MTPQSTSTVSPPLTPELVIQQILSSGKITSFERKWLLQATVSDTLLSSDEVDQIRHLVDRLQMGLIKVVD
ncbi:MAG TPA: hypothetical protein V6D10_20120 [Trichocoleus sp.]|jgi:hypothetical protein